MTEDEDRISLRYATECFDYDPSTGELRWKQTPWWHFASGTNRGWNTRHAGKIAGRELRGYRTVVLRGRLYFVHRLAWLLSHGAWPRCEIDHVNGDKADNRLANLREATRAQNQCNRGGAGRPNKTGFKGVRQIGKKFTAMVGYEGRKHYLGMFASADEAHEAYCRAAQKFHGDFANF